VASIDAAHRQRKDAAGKPWLGIGYHFVIGNGQGMPDGKIEPTSRWTKQLAGAHAGHNAQNENGIGICLVGDFTDVPPTPKQLASVKDLVAVLSKEYAIGPRNIVPHSELRATQCPGRLFPLEDVRAAARP